LGGLCHPPKPPAFLGRGLLVHWIISAFALHRPLE
jgi:hypothetical protein